MSGQRRGLAAGVLRSLLRVGEIPYAGAAAARNAAYDAGLLPVYHAGVPVVSVGNLTLGGTGKTPLVRWLAEWYRQQAVRVGLVSRGYRAAAGRPNDEARELALFLPDTPHLQNPDRVAAARVAVAQHGCELIVLDDAFQHRRLYRDLNLVLLDALAPFGFDHVFPRGLLRESRSGLRRADVVVLSRADAVGAAQRQALRQQVQTLAPRAVWVESVHRPCGLIAPSGERCGWEWLRGRTVAAFCGIGNPDGFRHTLQSCGGTVAGFREFPDHHPYTLADVRALADWAAGLAGVAGLICTLKDLVKLPPDCPAAVPLWAVAIELEFPCGLAALEERLRSLLPAKRTD